MISIPHIVLLCWQKYKHFSLVNNTQRSLIIVLRIDWLIGFNVFLAIFQLTWPCILYCAGSWRLCRSPYRACHSWSLVTDIWFESTIDYQQLISDVEPIHHLQYQRSETIICHEDSTLFCYYKYTLYFNCLQIQLIFKKILRTDVVL